MFTFIFLNCVLSTAVIIGATVRMVLREDQVSKEINREGREFLTRLRN